MKKVFVFVLCAAIIFFMLSGVIALVGDSAAMPATTTTPASPTDTSTTSASSNIDPNTGLPIVTKEKAGEALKNAGDQTVPISPELQLAARVLFGLKGDVGVSFNLLIVIIVILVCITILLKKIIQFIPGLKEEWVRWGVAVIVTLLASSSGAFVVMASYLFGFGANVKFLGDWHLLNLVLVIAILAVFAWGVSKLLGKMEEKTDVANAENVGFEAAAPAKVIKR